MNVLDLLAALRNAGIHIQVVDNQLEIVDPRERLTQELFARLKQKKHDIIRYLNNLSGEEFVFLGEREKKEYYPVSSVQKRMYVLQQMDVHNVHYNINSTFFLRENVEFEIIEKIFDIIISRHESLRTLFLVINGQIVQKVREKVEFKIEHLSAGKTEEASYRKKKRIFTEEPINEDRIIRDFIEPFDLFQAPLLRVMLIELREGDSLLFVDMHHIISDGTSLNIMEREFITLLENGELPETKLQYKDYSEWCNSCEQQKLIKGQEEYWLHELSTEMPIFDLPTDYPRPQVQSFSGSTISFFLSEEAVKSLFEINGKYDTTLFMTLLSIFHILLTILSGQEDIIIGSPVAGRRHVDLQDIIGMFVNIIFLRNKIHKEERFVDLLQAVKKKALLAFENSDYQFEDIVEKTQTPRIRGRNPIFDVMLSLQNQEEFTGEVTNYTDGIIIGNNNISKFDLTLRCVEIGKYLFCNFEYCTELFKPEKIVRFIGYFRKLISIIGANPEIQLSDIDILSTDELERILYEFNNTTVEYPGNKTIRRLFAEQVEKTPDKVALVGYSYEPEWDMKIKLGRSSQKRFVLTFRELEKKSNKIARFLIKKGVKPGMIIGIMTEPFIDIIAAALAVIKTGSAYLPVDSECPLDRLEYMLKDSGTRILLGGEGRIFPALEIPVEKVSIMGAAVDGEDGRNAAETAAPEDPVYIIYTSGTTGRPKGVVIRHRNLSNYCCWLSAAIHLTPNDRTVLISSFAFDLGNTAVYGALLNGGELHLLLKENYVEAGIILDYIRKNKITFLKLTPSLFSLLADSPDFFMETCKSLRIIILGGEAINLRDVKTTHDRCDHICFMNHYGPTETTIGSVSEFIDFDEFWEYEKGPTIGRPISNTNVFILDKNLELLPVGLEGELCISGAGLGCGYLNLPDLTGEKFVKNPYRTGERLYRTGDRARWRESGKIEFLGRSDRQLKIMGYRIEPREIERLLENCEGVEEAVVAVGKTMWDEKRGKNKGQLTAYIVPETSVGPPNKKFNSLEKDIKKYLENKFPVYMMPSYIVMLEKIPLTRNGKVDFNALPEPDEKIGTFYLPPADKIEEIMAELWRGLFGVERVSRDDNFFVLGGDSIKALQFSSRLLKSGLRVEIRDLFMHPTIREVKSCVKRVDRLAYQGTVTGEVPLTPVQCWFFDRNFTHKHHFNLALMLSHKEGKIDEPAMRKVLSGIVGHHDALRMVFEFKGNGVIQRNRGVDGNLFDMETFIIKELKNDKIEAEILRHANRLQSQMNLQKGPLVKAGLFKTGGGDYFLLAVHHLIVDGVSLRILLEDISLGYEQARRGDKIIFQDKTDSFKFWAEKLTEYARSKNALKELLYWQAVEQSGLDILPKDYPVAGEKRKIKNCERLRFSLNKEETGRLLKDVHRAYNTEITDILLAALAAAISLWSGVKKFAVNLEGHGRESLFTDVDISRTIAYFTTHFPVILEVKENESLSLLVKRVKEEVRRIPNRGFGYGVLKYLAPAEQKEGMDFKKEPEISFNYLGQFGREGGENSFTSAPVGVGELMNPEIEAEYVLDIGGIVVNDEFILSVSYNTYEYEKSTINRLSELLRTNLIAIIDHCVSKEERELTPSDVGDKDLTIEELQEIENMVNTSDPG